MGNCNSAICYCCGNKEGHLHGREEEENLQVSKTISIYKS
jgi:hypothetical protein